MARQKLVSTGDAEIDDVLDGDFDEVAETPEVEAAPEMSANAAMGAEIGRAIAAQLGSVIGGLTEEIQNTGFTRQIPISKYKAKTAFNPTGDRPGQNGRPKLVGKVYQNHYAVDPEKLTTDEIKLLNALKPGRYCKNRIWVEEITNNGNSVKNINYTNATVEARMDLMSEVGPTFKHMLQTMVNEAGA